MWAQCRSKTKFSTDKKISVLHATDAFKYSKALLKPIFAVIGFLEVCIFGNLWLALRALNFCKHMPFYYGVLPLILYNIIYNTTTFIVVTIDIVLPTAVMKLPGHQNIFFFFSFQWSLFILSWRTGYVRQRREAATFNLQMYLCTTENKGEV